MCNEYQLELDDAGNLVWVPVRVKRNKPPAKRVFPDSEGAVIRMDGDELVSDVMRWGFPPDPRRGDNRPQTNVRQPNYALWAPFTGVENRCLVPATSFCEWTDQPVAATGKKERRWFALNDEKPVFAFAGLWRSWEGARGTKKAPVEGEHLLYTFLTTKANDVVAPIHAKAMPVILTTKAECEAWMTLPTKDALKLQRPLPSELLKVVAGPA